MSFLRSFESHVPTKSRPYLWPILLDGILYGIPLTSQDTEAGLPGYFRCGLVPEHGLNLQYMIPLPEAALRPPFSLSQDLKLELTYYEEARKYIEAEAQILYRLSGTRQMDRLWPHRSCDFFELNSVYLNWRPGFDAGLFSCPKKEVQTMSPISKNGKLYYTKEQYEAAKYGSSALAYAQSQGYDLVRHGAYYTMREHDSMVFTPNGSWFWNSRGIHGGALEFQIYYEGKTVTEAVLTLAGEQEQINTQPRTRPQATPVPEENISRQIPEKQEFKAPAKAQNFKQLFYYLCSERGLEKSVVQEMIRQGRVYQSEAKLPGKRSLYNATFVYKDLQGNPVGAYQRGMIDQEGQAPYKRDAPGSDKQWGWILESPSYPAAEVRVFEAAIDAASDASLAAMRQGNDWRKESVDRLSLEGLNYTPLENYLRLHPDVRTIVLQLDGDEAGRRSAKEFADRLTAQGYKVFDKQPPLHMKDWNLFLQDVRSMEVELSASCDQTPALEP